MIYVADDIPDSFNNLASHINLTGRYKVIEGRQCWEIVTSKFVSGIKKGTYGGWIESPNNINLGSRAWCTENVVLLGSTVLYGDSYISGKTLVRDSVVTDSYVNDLTNLSTGEGDCFDLVISSSQFRNSIINGYGSIKDSDLVSVNLNKILGYKMLNLDTIALSSCEIDSEKLKIINACIRDINLFDLKKAENILLSGTSKNGRRTEVSLDDRFDSLLSNFKYLNTFEPREIDTDSFYNALMSYRANFNIVASGVESLVQLQRLLG